METAPILVTCPRAIPPYLRQEMEALGFPIVATFPAGVETVGTFDDCLKLNLRLRTAHRVLFRLGSWKLRTPNEMHEAIYNVPWEDWISADGYLSVISSISTAEIDNTQYANVRCKDAIVDRIRDKKGRRPDSGSSIDGAVVYLYWHKDECMVYIDTSGTPLSERGYRIHPGKAPMRESLAAAVIDATLWKPGEAFVNPMCGSGTLGIEAAMMAQGIAPGLNRSKFGFMSVLKYNAALWKQLTKEARSEVNRKAVGTIVCSDFDAVVLDKARENSRRAGVEHAIRFAKCDFRDTQVPEPPGVVVINPEYGLRLGDTGHLEYVYEEIGDFFKKKCNGYTGYVFTGNFALAKKIGLRSKRRVEFWSADVECRLIEFELYSGSLKGTVFSPDHD